MCQSLQLDHLIVVVGLILLCLLHTQLYFDNQVSCLIRGWRFHQVSSLKYFSNGAIAPVHCTSAGTGVAPILWCILHPMSRRLVYVQIWCSKFF